MKTVAKHFIERLYRNDAEVLWLAGGHVAIGLGGLVGISLLTRAMEPTSFGALSLYVGIASLGMSTLINPIIQTGMRFFSAAADESDLRSIRTTTLWWLTGILVCLMILAAVLAFFVEGMTGLSWQVPILIAGLILVDGYRAYETSMLNAARQQRQFVLWRSVDAWVRPLSAVFCILIFGVAAWPGLMGYMLGTLIVAVLFWLSIRPDRLALAVVRKRDRRTETPTNSSALIRYALPLAPIGLLGWVLGTGDRYIIGGMISLEATGIYAAIYSITSRPFMALGAFLDVLLRPRLYDAVSTANWPKFRQLVLTWFVTCLAVSLLFFLAALLFAKPLTRALLGPDFMDSAALMPWIALGYGFSTAYQPLLRILHAFLLSSYTLLIQVVTTLVGVTATVVGISFAGLTGAAIAIPVCFSLRLIIAAVLLSRSEKVRHAIQACET